MKPIPVEKLFPEASSITSVEGEFVNKEQLVEKFSADKKTAIESISVVREQIERLQVEEKRLLEVNLHLQGCLHALDELKENPQPALEMVPAPVEEKEEEKLNAVEKLCNEPDSYEPTC